MITASVSDHNPVFLAVFENEKLWLEDLGLRGFGGVPGSSGRLP
jgi:hypothetical protein